MNSLSKYTVFALVLLFTAGLALAQPQPPANGPGNGQGNPPAGPGHPILRCLQIVNLTEDQQSQIKGILEAAAPTLKALHETLATDRQALREAIDATPQDGCAIGSALIQVQADEKAIRAELDKTKASIEALLTTEQKLKLAGCLEAPKDGPGPGQGN
ncbi:MAG: periplasmic heavy metal sensor [Acidobacteria bacterium]|nr:periplasmic heavy metal sensor [Acidobacteriota bacterium]